MRLGFVLTKEQGAYGRLGWEHVQTVLEVSGAPDELATRLRPWALDLVTRERCGDGRYFAYLVELDDDGKFDTYLALSMADVIWFYEQEYVPAS